MTLRDRLRGVRIGFEAAFAVVSLGLATPLYAAAHAPLQDLPQHIAAVSVLRRLLFGSSLDAVFEVTLSRTQYLLVYALGVPLSALLGAEGAVRLLAAASLVAIPYALRFALRRSGGDERRRGQSGAGPAVGAGTDEAAMRRTARLARVVLYRPTIPPGAKNISRIRSAPSMIGVAGFIASGR